MIRKNSNQALIYSTKVQAGVTVNVEKDNFYSQVFVCYIEGLKSLNVSFFIKSLPCLMPHGCGFNPSYNHASPLLPVGAKYISMVSL